MQNAQIAVIAKVSLDVAYKYTRPAPNSLPLKSQLNLIYPPQNSPNVLSYSSGIGNQCLWNRM
jgi:hypothetical protein